jgi:hypothetical protein
VSAERKDNLMTPVADLHRTRGSFDAEAANRVMSIPGRVARLIPVLASGLTGLAIGFAVSGLSRRPTPARIRKF